LIPGDITRYLVNMAMTLRLSDEETEALRRKAIDEGRSMQQVAQDAISQYTHDRPARVRAMIDEIVMEDAELLERLAR
jgi:predicted transcriptional regulator